jgi:hypothetical protein
MITYKILEEDGMVVIEPTGPITQSDLEVLTRDVDNYIRQKGNAQGHDNTFTIIPTVA